MLTGEREGPAQTGGNAGSHLQRGILWSQRIARPDRGRACGKLREHRSQRDVKQAFRTNIDAMVATLRASADAPTLVVSHAGVMMFLSKALRKHGFKGPQFRMPECGKLYVFEGEWN